MSGTWSRQALLIASLVVSLKVAVAGDLKVFTLRERSGVSHGSQVVELAYGTKVNLSQTYMLGPGGTEVAFQQLSNGNILVQTDLPANSTKVFQLMSGRAPTAASPVSVTTKSDSFEISNGLTGVRVARPQEAGIPSLAPVQGIQLKDSTWTAVGPNYLYVPGDGPYAKMVQLIPLTVSTQIVEQGPLQATIVVSYTFDRPPLYQTVLLIPGGSGHYTSTIKLQAGQSAIVMEDETDMDLQYYLNTQAPVQPTQLRYRGHVATQLQFGWQSNGQIYGLIGARANSDATRDLPQNLPVYSSYLTADYSSNGGYQLLKRVSQWDIWGPDGGWYWLMYNAQAAAAAPVLGIFAGQASRAVGTNASGPGLYSLPDNGQGIRASGINLRINRRGPDGSLATTVRLQWGIFVGTKGADLADPNQLQTIQQPLNLYGGINLSKVLGYQTSYPDPPGGWSSMYLSRAQTQALIQRVRTDDTFYSNMYHADGTMKPILDAWRDTSGTLAKALVNQITTSAQTILNVLINGNGIYDFNYGYIMGGELMSQWEATASALLAAGQLAPADQAQLKAVLALFGNILWDDDFAPMQNGSGINLGTQNMPVQSISYRYQYTLLLAQAQYPGMLGARLQAAQTDPMQTLQDQVNDWGAQHGSPHYAQASMDPLLDSLQQIKVAGQGDAFQSQPKLAKFADFYLNFQTPPEVRFGGVRKMVSLGDGATESNSMFGQLATGFADSNPGLSQRLMQAWMEGGSSQSGYAGNAALKVDQTLSAAPQQLTSGTYPGYYSVLRSGVGSGQENAAWVINGNWYDDHNHDDQGSLALYALGAPLSIDWGDGQVAPRTIGGYFHNLVLPASAIGAPWDQDSLLVSTVDSPWSNPQQVAFESFGASSRSVSSFTAADGTTWTRTLRMLSGNAAAPVILIEDNFGGAGANLPKVWSMNMMSNAAVQTPQGTVIPPLRMWSSLAGGPQQLPSARPAQSLAAGLNRFQFTGQWKIDWDLYTYSSQTQQALIGNWSHDWHPDVERLQFLTANGRAFRERQNILRLRGQGPFEAVILPYIKGQNPATEVTTQGGRIVIRADGVETLVDKSIYAYRDQKRTIVTNYGKNPITVYDIQVSGGPAEVRIQGAHATITVHGAGGQRRLVLPEKYTPSTAVRVVDGVYVIDYQGGSTVTIELQARP